MDNYHRMERGVLQRRYYPTVGEAYCVPVVPRQVVPNVLSYYHDVGLTKHMGVAKTSVVIKQQLWWKGMDADIRRYIRSCPWCQKYKTTAGGGKPLPQPKVVRGVNSMLSVDIAGPYDHVAGIPLHILTVVDVFSNYGEVYLLSALGTKDVLAQLDTQWMLRYGPPKVILTDRGGQFQNEFDAWCGRKDIKHRRTTAYHPQTNTHAERFHRWIKERLSILVSQTEGDWFEPLAEVVHGHNIAPIAGLGEASPFLLFFNRKPNLPGDDRLSLGSIKSTGLTRDEQEELHMRVVALREKERAARERRYHEQQGRAAPTFEPGDLVMIKMPKKGKLDPQWDGPWPVIRRINPALYEVYRKKWG